jgi:hypothetical protein
MKVLSHKELLKKWQKRLRLTDWVIVLEDNAYPSDFTNQDCAGECEWQETNKTAVIRILNPFCYGERITPFNFEKTLVHELLHIKFCFIENSGNELQDRITHQLIEELAKAFTEKL